MPKENIRIISAGAGSGKTHRLTEELAGLVGDGKGKISPEKIIATTFTRKAAAELVERLRQFLLKKGRQTEAERISFSYISTVNGVSGQLLQHLAFEAGISPMQEVIPEEEQQILFNRALTDVVDEVRAARLDAIAARFGGIDWREALKSGVDAARSNNCDPVDFDAFGLHSVTELVSFLTAPAEKEEVLDAALATAVRNAAAAIRANSADETKVTGN